MKTNLKNLAVKKLASRYVKIVEWSDEDRCFIGRCPELFGGGCHGDDEIKVYAELSVLVEEVVADFLAEGQKLPPPIKAEKYSGKFVFRPGAELHKALSVRAHLEGKSLNQVVLDAVKARESSKAPATAAKRTPVPAQRARLGRKMATA